MSRRKRRAGITPEQVKKVWDSFDKPTVRGVTRALQQAGIAIHRPTVERWKNQEFKSSKSGETQSGMAVAALDCMLPVLTGRPEVRISEYIPPLKQAFDGRLKALEALTDETLLTLHTRTMYMSNILIAEEMTRQREHLVKNFPAEAGNLARALAESAASAGDTWQQVFALRDRAMKVAEITNSTNERALNGEILPPSQIGQNTVDPLAFEFAAYEAEITMRARLRRNGGA